MLTLHIPLCSTAAIVKLFLAPYSPPVRIFFVTSMCVMLTWENCACWARCHHLCLHTCMIFGPMARS